MLTTVQPGTLVADYATPKDLGAIRAAGYPVVARYLSHNWKGLTFRELLQIFAAGLDLILLFELSTTRSHAGAAAGTVDGNAARALARELGAPDGVLIIACCDTKSTAADVPYFDAFDAAANPMVGGCYGDWDLIQARGWRCACNSMPAALSWSGYRVHPLTHLRQFGASKVRVPGTDHNEVLRPFGGVWSADPVSSPPAPKPVLIVPEPTVDRSFLAALVANQEVRKVQDVCNFWKWTDALGRRLTVDGKFGRLTEQGVRSAQIGLRVPVTGKWDEATANAYRWMLIMFDAAGY